MLLRRSVHARLVVTGQRGGIAGRRHLDGLPILGLIGIGAGMPALTRYNSAASGRRRMKHRPRRSQRVEAGMTNNMSYFFAMFRLFVIRQCRFFTQ